MAKRTHPPLSEPARAVVAGADIITDVKRSERVAVALEAARFWVQHDLDVRNDVAAVILDSHARMAKRQPKRKIDPEQLRRRTTAVYAARYLSGRTPPHKGKDVYRKALDLLAIKHDDSQLDKLRKWFELNEKNGTLPRVDKKLFAHFTKNHPLHAAV